MDYIEMAKKIEVEKMTITTLSDAINEGGLPTWEATLAAYKAGDKAEAGKLLFSMVDDYLYEIAEEKAPDLEYQLQIDAAESYADIKREDRLMRSAA